MANTKSKPNPWLIAAWPGMGNVAVIAAGYLIQGLDMRQVAMLPSRKHFDVKEVEVKGGIVATPHIPRGIFFRWNNPGPGRDIIVFLGESQPASATYAYAHELLDKAVAMDVDRVVTFASMASALHPSEDPRVSGVATDDKTLDELRLAEVEPLEDGQIGGLNGVLLGAAAGRGMTGMGLLAEIPFFAAAVPNPKAARAALSVFSILADIDISLEELNKYAAAMDRAIIEAMEKLEQEASEGPGGAPGAGDDDDEDDDPDPSQFPQAEARPNPPPVPPVPPTSAASSSESPKTPPGPKDRKLDYATRNRIESLFQQARTDRDKAVHLKEELDRLGIYPLYEDRFLDLFRRAE